MKASRAALTIASRNYLAHAATLAESFLRVHPDHDFIIALVDRAEGRVPARLDCGAEVIEIGNFAIPDLGRFIYRYSIMELNTAVKPFVLLDLFERRGYDTIIYLDPDIQIFRPLDIILAALAHASIVLLPHIRRPFGDGAIPSDLTILQSGTYNLGFIGLRAGDTTRNMLQWWSSKLYRDCVVDIPKGLFVDQKWIDLVPGLFPDHRVVGDAGCNVAYWNLHERPVGRVDGEWRAGGEPLVFFHFSGYSPFTPERLSKHQNRHDLRCMPELRALTDAYAATLLDHGHEAASAVPYAFATLSSGVRLPLELVRDAMQWAAHAAVPTPCPISEPDAFCRWLMSRNVIPHRPQVAVLFHFLLERRGDVVQAYPHAVHDSRDSGFREWVRTSGVREYEIADLFAYEDPEAVDDPVADAFNRLRAAGRQDILARFAARWTDPEVFTAFADWFGSASARSLRCERRHTDALKQAAPAVTRILNLYFLRPDLQERFASPAEPGFSGWLRENRYAIELRAPEISLFEEFASGSRELLDKMCFLYGRRRSTRNPQVSLYTIEARLRDVAAGMDAATAAGLLARELPIAAGDQVKDLEALEAHEREGRGIAGLEGRATFELRRSIRDGLARRDPEQLRVNVAGYFAATSGMGESARSLRAELAAAGASLAALTLPHPAAQSPCIPERAALFGWPAAGVDVSVIVANADVAPQAQAFVPSHFAGRRSVAYWVWETESLPRRFADAATGFDEIWTPSRYSAEAIAKTITGKPVRVLRHAIDFASLDRASPNRRRFGLPPDATLLGFLFDPLSGLERKNVAGLVEAFSRAFREDDDCWLVLKVNGHPFPGYEYERLRARCDHARVLFVEGTLDRDGTCSFMRSLDAYVSLHRSEGFGLTCAEAMAIGVPVMATGYSGNLEYMSPDNSLLVPARVVETDRPHDAYPAGSRWSDPDLDAASAMMRTLKDPRLREALGAKGRESVRRILDVRALGREAQQLLGSLARQR